MVKKSYKVSRCVVSIISSIVLALSLCPFGQAFANELGGGQPSEPKFVSSINTNVNLQNIQADYYVKSDGSDAIDNSGNSATSPLASLSRAVNLCNDSTKPNVVICVIGKVFSSNCARFTDDKVEKNVKIIGIPDDSGIPAQIVRSEDFSSIQDNARSTYNPALIEVTNPNERNITLTLENIIIDDNGLRMGDHLLQADSEGDGSTKIPLYSQISDNQIQYVNLPNTTIAQDAVIAAYSANSKIVLGNGAVIQNFGGMSAVRVSSGTFVMEKGSEIRDVFDQADMSVNREKSKYQDDTGEYAAGYGVAGAVWIQAGSFVMEPGSEIDGINSARAIYLDGGSASIGGSINDITGNSDMWQGESGVGVHARNNASATLRDTGVISDCVAGGSKSGGEPSVAGIYGSNFTMEKGSEITRITNLKAVYMDDSGYRYEHKALINGKISSISNGQVMRSWYGHIELGETGIVRDCVSELLLYTNNGSKYTIKGDIVDNNLNGGTALYLANQSGGQVECTIEEGSLISGNNGLALKVNNGSKCVMNGGVIADNNAAVEVSGKKEHSGVTFIMNNGVISENGVGITITNNSDNGDTRTFVEIKGGSIVDNGSSNQISWTNGSASNSSERIYIAPNVLRSSDGNPGDFGVSTSFGNIFFPDANEPLFLGTSSQNAFERIKTFVLNESAQNPSYGELAVVGNYGLWFRAYDDGKPFSFVMDRPESVSEGAGLYVACIPLDVDGCPSNGLSTFTRISNESTLSVSLEGLVNGGSYALALVSSSIEYVSIEPADISIYMGADKGYEGVVDEGGAIVSNAAFPIPGFKVNFPANIAQHVDDLKLVATAVDGSQLAWRFEKYGDGDHNIFRIVPSENGSDRPLRVQITSGNEVVTDSAFDPTEFLNCDLSMRVYDEGVNQDTISVKYGNTVYPVYTHDPEATIVVRATTDSVEYAALSSELPKHDAPGLRLGENTRCFLNDSGVEIRDISGVALLFDDIFEMGASEANCELLKKRAENSIFEGTSLNRQYEFKYLDLVDQNNGNVWVKANGSVTVYWPLPEGADSEDVFTVLHFEGLHREMGVDHIASEIDKAYVEELDCSVVGDHVEFEVESGNFSPFALVWAEDGGGSVTPPQPQTVTLHYETNGGRPLADEEHAIGTKADLKTPLREGCTFAGWYLDETLTKPAEDPLTMDADKTVWAKWESTAVPGGFTSDHINYVLGRDTDQGRLIMPESNITRAEAAAMFYRLLDEGTRAEYYRESSTFPDVELGAWYEPAVGTLQAMGILRGDDGVGTVRPDDPITRAELAAMAGRFDDDGEWPDMEPFADMDGHWAERIVLVAAENGWVLGDEGSDKFRPDDPITRAETMAIANRVLQRLPEDESDLIAGRVQWPDNQDKEKWYWLVVEEATNNHDHTLKSDGVHERWTALLKNEDWGE